MADVGHAVLGNAVLAVCEERGADEPVLEVDGRETLHAHGPRDVGHDLRQVG